VGSELWIDPWPSVTIRIPHAQWRCSGVREFALSISDGPTVGPLSRGWELATEVLQPDVTAPLLLGGSRQVDVAALAVWALAEGHSVVLQPEGTTPDVAGLRVTLERTGTSTGVSTAHASTPGWQLGMYTSGSTRTARGYGFSLAQLDQLAAWYTAIYSVTSASVVVTHLPVTYNFTFVAGVYLAATLGARLHLSTSPQSVFADTAELARHHDRCVVLANPVLLSTPPTFRLPENVLIDSGGAPLSTTAIQHYREHVADLREGYGLTETGSLTHFDSESTADTLGTVGAAMPGVETDIVARNGQPRISVATPAMGTPITAHSSPSAGRLITSDVGAIDSQEHLRILGRSDDHAVADLWPRDVLDAIGPLLGTACALVRHPSPEQVHVRVRQALPGDGLAAIRARVADRTGLPPTAVTIDTADQHLLHSHKIPRTAAAKIR
jgi:hypothetical protein